VPDRKGNLQSLERYEIIALTLFCLPLSRDPLYALGLGCMAFIKGMYSIGMHLYITDECLSVYALSLVPVSVAISVCH
jgi:hypothetical protein